MIDESKFGVKIPLQLSLSKEICFTFIKALRDVVSDFQNNKTNPLITLLKNKSGNIKDSDYAPIKDLINDLNGRIEGLPDIQTISNDIKDTIKDAVGDTYSPSSLTIKSSLSDEAEKLLQSLRLYIGEPNETYEGSIYELSLGGANLIYLTLKLLEYKYQKTDNAFANFLLIEEPEAHIHTHIQKTLFDKIDATDTQIIYSTYSTHISEVCNISNMNILTKLNNYAEVYQPANGLSKETATRIERYLDAKRSNLLFAKGVIMVEGDAEEILIPILVKKVLGVSLDELGISLINIGSTGFENIADLFHADRINRNCSIITDLDDPIESTTANPRDTPEIKQYKIDLENSSKAGKEREIRLNEYIEHNVWVDVFYAKYTFEIDLIMAGNSPEFIATLKDIYKTQKKITEIENMFKSKQIEICGKAALKVAEYVGKGWFAILLSKYLFYKTEIPKYILNAISFAKEDFSNTIIYDIVNYRIDSYISEHKPKINFTASKATLEEFKNGKIDLMTLISELQKVIPKDQLIYFLQSI